MNKLHFIHETIINICNSEFQNENDLQTIAEELAIRWRIPHMEDHICKFFFIEWDYKTVHSKWSTDNETDLLNHFNESGEYQGHIKTTSEDIETIYSSIIK